MPPRPGTTKKVLTEAEKRRSAPKKTLLPVDQVKRLFVTLAAQINGGHFSNAVKTCDKILRVDSQHQVAIQTKLYLALQTEKYDVALELLNSSANDNFMFEKAYSLYRLNREQEVATLLTDLQSRVSNDDIQYRGVLHLDAQLNYRQGQYQKAADIYAQLLDDCAEDSDEHADLLTNLNATQIHLEFMETGFLQTLDTLPVPVANGLESAPVPTLPQMSTATSANTTRMNETTSNVIPGNATKKTPKSRVPKNVIPGVTPPPDPERWLKKSERSNYGQGAGRRRKMAGGATQGSAAEITPINANLKSSAAKQKKRR